MNPCDVREKLVEALKLDLVGPTDGLGTIDEVLSQPPSRWYLTGFLVPQDADVEQRADEASNDELDEVSDSHGLDDAATPEPAAVRQRYLPSSIGVSVLVPATTQRLRIVVRWGDYRLQKEEEEHGGPTEWKRQPREEMLTLDVPEMTKQPVELDVPKSDGLQVVLSVRPVHSDGDDGGLPIGSRSVSVFLVNRRTPVPDVKKDEAFAFQAQLDVTGDKSFIARPNLRSLESEDWDERVADLQYHNACEFAVGHSVATEAVIAPECECQVVRTCWIPQAQVEFVAPAEMSGVALSMDALGQLADGADAQAKLGKLVTDYRAWIGKQRSAIPKSPPARRETGQELMRRAEEAAKRIAKGIAVLANEDCLEAFRVANRAMSAAAKRRLGLLQGVPPETIKPEWRPFQLAFILMNLPGIAKPTEHDRDIVDLLFFPTGGGKTEAYFGLSAFTLVLRRLRNPGISSAGVSVLMRYTLRLLTLDQLGRAAALICALELERQQNVQSLGEWPFEIGLWVGKAATPNVMGQKGDGKSETARLKTIAYKNDDRKPIPIPIEECPWCGTKFKTSSFQLLPNQEFPIDLRIVCVNRDCEFSYGRPLPILAVDESIYRRLPCFIIATVDKFAAMPWTGEVGGFFGRVQRYNREGFYGPCAQGEGQPLPVERLPPPELIIQDELHLISGPLGTMVGLYETALDELSRREIDGRVVRPKIVASTATVRRAEKQIRALFNRKSVDIFPPPGPNRRDSFFAETQSPQQSNARLYVGIAAQGRSPKVAMLRTYLVLLAATQKWYEKLGGKKNPANPADSYMTLLGYFNSLRELGGARRVIEDEVGNRVKGYVDRRRVGESEGLFQNRQIAYEVVELTSRVSTDKVAEARRLLSHTFVEKDRVDVAIATNMISVGLDISRLGLMVVFGQPKTSAEYIQATSRVGRDRNRPGLVVTLLNIHKPRDRSHYERFAAYHESFYRSVEATSVTPFSPRAMDRGIAGTLVGLARQIHRPMTPARGAGEILNERPNLDFLVDCLGERARSHADRSPEDAERLRQSVRQRVLDLFDEWSRIVMDLGAVGATLQYQEYETGAARPLLHAFLDKELKTLPPRYRKFRANRSLRDVEPDVNLWLKTLDDRDVEEDEA